MKNVIELKINPEFQSQIPPLTDEEYEQLRENILSEGEVYEPIIVWNGTIVDGHNRWKIIKENWEQLKDNYRTKEMSFSNKWEAFDWMYRNQLGRRNLTKNQRSYMIGKMYDVQKLAQGGDRRSEEFSSGQNDHLKTDKTHEVKAEAVIAEELGIGSRTVRRAYDFAKGIDALKDVSSEAADMVLKGRSNVKKKDIQIIPSLKKNAIEEVARAIVNGDPIPQQALQPESKPRGWTKADREERNKLETIATDMYDRSTVPEYTVENLVDDIQLCAEGFVRQIKNTLRDRSAVLTDENKTIVADAVDLYIIKEIEKVRNLLK